jgi:hypothetical protein
MVIQPQDLNVSAFKLYNFSDANCFSLFRYLPALATLTTSLLSLEHASLSLFFLFFCSIGV